MPILPMPGYGIVGYACWSAACAAASPLGIPVAAIQIKMKQSTLCGVNTRYNKDIYWHQI